MFVELSSLPHPTLPHPTPPTHTHTQDVTIRYRQLHPGFEGSRELKLITVSFVCMCAVYTSVSVNLLAEYILLGSVYMNTPSNAISLHFLSHAGPAGSC